MLSDQAEIHQHNALQWSLLGTPKCVICKHKMYTYSYELDSFSDSTSCTIHSSQINVKQSAVNHSVTQCPLMNSHCYSMPTHEQSLLLNALSWTVTVTQCPLMNSQYWAAWARRAPTFIDCVWRHSTRTDRRFNMNLTVSKLNHSKTMLQVSWWPLK